MSLLYPRTVSIRRQNPPLVEGGQLGYGGSSPVQETVIFTGLSAQISYERVGRGDPANLPTDARRANYTVTLPPSITATVLGQVQVDDIVVDELGQRYQVFAPDWQITGVTLHVELLVV